LELIKKLRVGYKGDEEGKGKLTDEQLNAIFWGDFQLEPQRFLATIRDLEKEEMQQARAGGGVQEVAATQGVKLTGSILGTSGVTAKDLERNTNSGNFVASSQKVTMPGQQNASGSAGGSGADPMPPLSGGMGGGLGVAGLAKLPKLEL
jgi:hypothetical protein